MGARLRLMYVCGGRTALQNRKTNKRVSVAVITVVLVESLKQSDPRSRVSKKGPRNAFLYVRVYTYDITRWSFESNGVNGRMD